MKSATLGKPTSKVEVTGITPFGIWILLHGTEKFLSFGDFPWFKDATVAQISAVEAPSDHHLYWPELDVDLAIASIDDPQRFPLVAKPLKPATTLNRQPPPRAPRTRS